MSISVTDLNNSEYVNNQVKHLKNLEFLKKFEESQKPITDTYQGVFDLVKTTESLYKLLVRMKSLPSSERGNSIISIIERVLQLPDELCSELTNKQNQLIQSIAIKQQVLEGLDLDINQKLDILTLLNRRIEKTKEKLDSVNLSSQPNHVSVDTGLIVNYPNREYNYGRISYIKRVFSKVRGFVRRSP